MNILNKNLLMQNLNDLMELEYKEMCEYSTSAECSKAKEGFEVQYNKQKKKIELIQSAKNEILFPSFDEHNKNKTKDK